MFSKILIANRGEIAIRVMRACRELGVASVAVYSDADAGAPHVLAADEAVRIGSAAAAASYLRGEAIIDAALKVGAEAVHPGYGFLSEREWFARAVGDAGLTFIGPSPSAIASLGSKTAARGLALGAGVPVVPGTTERLEDLRDALRAARETGFPLLLKAAAGGGGKGMRVVSAERELEGAFDAARRESMASFGDDAIYLEKYISRPRHVEVQVLADNHGQVLHFGERECSVQRRHQKMIEEAPSVAVGADLRARMGASAVTLARAASYSSAGTCEFLLDERGDYFFLEMNTRLQVEHPVTELVYGHDLVQWQIRIAAGDKLPMKQKELVPRGWAMECRITSESPEDGFLPSTGRIEYMTIPCGPGVRWDGGIEVGTEVGLHYDPMLAKLIVWAGDREGCIARMKRALRELAIVGVDTSREFHLRVFDDDDFVNGRIDVQWLERRLPQLLSAREPTALDEMAAIAAVLLMTRGATIGPAAAERASASSGSAPRQREGWPREQWRTAEHGKHA